MKTQSFAGISLPISLQYGVPLDFLKGGEEDPKTSPRSQGNFGGILDDKL